MDPNYLTTPTTLFGPAEWVFFVASIAAALGGLYAAFLHNDANTIRLGAIRPIGYALAVVGIVGVIVGGVRLGGIALAPVWMTVLTIALLLVGIYAVYVVAMLLPQRLAAAQAQRSSRGPARGATQRSAPQIRSSNGADAPVAGAAGTSSRRGSRRDRKRRSK